MKKEKIPSFYNSLERIMLENSVEAYSLLFKRSKKGYVCYRVNCNAYKHAPKSVIKKICALLEYSKDESFNGYFGKAGLGEVYLEIINDIVDNVGFHVMFKLKEDAPGQKYRPRFIQVYEIRDVVSLNGMIKDCHLSHLYFTGRDCNLWDPLVEFMNYSKLNAGCMRLREEAPGLYAPDGFCQCWQKSNKKVRMLLELFGPFNMEDEDGIPLFFLNPPKDFIDKMGPEGDISFQIKKRRVKNEK